jgi:hypothetical protein
METEIWKVADNIIGYTQKKMRNKWFDEECGVVNEEKNALRARITHKNITRATNYTGKLDQKGIYKKR